MTDKSSKNAKDVFKDRGSSETIFTNLSGVEARQLFVSRLFHWQQLLHPSFVFPAVTTRDTNNQ